jgi:hypothetical protein
MTSIFSSLCNQIAVASALASTYDVPKKPLSTLPNEMTRYVATSPKSDNDDGAIIYGSV